MTEIHNEGCECEMCRWANKSSSPPVTSPALDFEQEWNSAPARHRRYSYQEDALYWFVRGVRCGQLGQMVEENRVFRAMAAQRGLVLDGIEREK